MLFHLDTSLTAGVAIEIEVTERATAGDIAAACSRRSGRVVAAMWVGGELLSHDHSAGAWPLRHGAVLTAGPAPWPVSPRGAHAAVSAGPDAGWVAPIAQAVVLGRSPSLDRVDSGVLAVTIADPALDASHIAVSTGRSGIVWRDLATANGTRERGVPHRLASMRKRGGIATSGAILEAGHTEVALRWSDRASEPAPSVVNGAAPPALPDPTAPGGADVRWCGPVALRGPIALATARTIVLARGRRPPPSTRTGEGVCASVALAREDWLRWLPAAAETDGVIVMEPSRSEVAALEVDCSPRASVVRWEGSTLRQRPVGVGINAANLAARAVASRHAPPLPSCLTWADLDPVPAGAVAWALAEDGEQLVWRPWGDGGHALVAGAAGSGATTALLTACMGLSVGWPPGELELVIIAPAGNAQWADCVALPHTAAVALSTNESDALAAMSSPPAATRRLVVVDGLHRYGSARVARAVATAFGESTRSTRLLVSTSRLPGVVSPSMLAAAGTVMALRMADDAASVDVMGVPHAAAIAEDDPGTAIVRLRGRAAKVRVATPIADPTAPVRFADAAPLVGRSLADAILAANQRA